jgi:hypothetical protein
MKLQPCPFCGAPATIVDATNFPEIPGVGSFYAQCTNHPGVNQKDPCGAWHSGRTPAEAALKWNRRETGAPGHARVREPLPSNICFKGGNP